VKAQIRILRWDPKGTGEPQYKAYGVPYSRKDKVLGSLVYIYNKLDPCLSFKYNCKGRHCGECSMTINGKPGLSCEVSMSRDLTLEPLKNLPLVKDLVIDRTQIYKKIFSQLSSVKSTKIKTDSLEKVHMEIVNKIIHLEGCIHCFCCMSVCPVYAEDREAFIGPLGLLALAADYERAPYLKIHEKASLCTECGRCEEVCPRNIHILGEAIKGLKDVTYSK
jgi:fumarate reductase (CoM/CoB) subunit B